MGADGSGRKKLVEERFLRRWLADGSKIVYFSSITSPYQIYIMNPDGSNKKQPHIECPPPLNFAP